MMWWEILKNAKISSKGKGTTLSSDRIKIKKPKKEECKEKLLQYIKNSKQSNFFISEDIGKIENKEDWKDLTEKQACDMIRLIDDNWVMENETMLRFFQRHNFQSLVNRANILDIKVGQYTFRRFIRGSRAFSNISEKGASENITRKLYISYGFSLTENLNNNSIVPSTWGIMGTFETADWPIIRSMGNIDWRK